MRYLRTSLILTAIFFLTAPVYIFLAPRWSSLAGLPLQPLAGIVFPIFGLLAFTLVSFQVMIGPNIRWLRQIFPKIYLYHRWEGIFTLLFATLHPLMIWIAFGFTAAFVRRSFLPANLRGWALIGIITYLLMILTVGTAFAAWKLSTFSRSWRSVHYLNYGVFIFGWIHSWFIGSDIRTTSLKYIWILYAVVGVGSLLVRFISPTTVRRAPTPSTSSPRSAISSRE